MGDSFGLACAPREIVQREIERGAPGKEAAKVHASRACAPSWRRWGRFAPGLLVSLLVVPACGHAPGISGAAQGSPQAIPAAPAPNVAMMSAGGVRLYARGDAWDGAPANLGAMVTPLAVRIENHSGGPIELLYDRFALVAADGRQFHPLPLLPLSARPGAPAPLQPAYQPAGFFIAPRFAPAYTRLPAWRSALARDESLYRLDYGKWGAGPPSLDVLTKGLPEGMLADGGAISGFLYFEREARGHHDLTFQADLTAGDWKRHVALIEIPFRIP